MVLTRSNSESGEVADALRARGLPCTLLQAERLFGEIEAHDVADLLDAIAAPRDRSRRLRAWATAFFAVPWDRLAAVARAPRAPRRARRPPAGRAAVRVERARTAPRLRAAVRPDPRRHAVRRARAARARRRARDRQHPAGDRAVDPRGRARARRDPRAGPPAA